MSAISLQLDTSDLTARLIRLETALANSVSTNSILVTQLTVCNASLARLELKVDAAIKGITTIMADESVVAALLTKIDQTTTQIGTNLTAVGGNVTALSASATQISTEVDTLVSGMQNAGVSQALIDQATAVGAKMDTLSGQADTTAQSVNALVPVLNAIATKGAGNPVPVAVPPAPAPDPNAPPAS